MPKGAPAIKLLRISLLVALLSAGICGCWSGYEITSRAIIGSFGIDLDSRDRPILAVEVLNPQAIARGTGMYGTASDISGWVFMEPAPSISQALEQISRRIPRVPFYGHLSTVVYGRNYAFKGVSPMLDFLTRQDDIRKTISISVCDTAVGLLQRPMMEDLAGLTLEDLSATSWYSSMADAVTISEFMRRLDEPGIEPIAMHTVGRKTYDIIVMREGTVPRQAIGKEGVVDRPKASEVPDPRAVSPEPVDPQDNLQGSGLPSTEQSILMGLTVFKDDRAVGFLDGYEARGYLWVHGTVRHGYISVPHPAVPGATVTLEVHGSRGTQKAHLAGETPRISIRIRTEMLISEASAPINVLDPGVLDQLEESARQAIRSEVDQTLQKVQTEYRSDIYGFGAEFYRHFRRYWHQAEAQWDDIFPTIQVDVEVDLEVVRSGLLFKR